MGGNSENNYWQGTERYNALGAYRNDFAEATGSAVTQVLEGLGFFDHRKLLLEIGAGVGELAHLVGMKNWPHVIQSDPNDDAVASNPLTITKGFFRRSYHRKAVIDAELLPFGDDSLDGIVGHACLDVVTNPLNVLEESMRVLKPGGSIVHFLDLIPDVMHLVPYEINRGFLPFPISGEFDDLTSTYTNIPISGENDLKTIVGQVINLNGKTNRDLIIDYTHWVRHMLYHKEQQHRLSKQLRPYMYEVSKKRKVEKGLWGDLFAEVYKGFFQEAGLDVQMAEWVEGMAAVPRKTRSGIMAKYPEGNVWLSERGAPKSFRLEDPRLSEDYVIARSQVNVLIGTKR